MEKGGTIKIVMVKDSTLIWQVIFYTFNSPSLPLPPHTHTHTHTQHLEAMKSVDSLYGQALALANIAKTYEYMANLSKACETLELVSTMSLDLWNTSFLLSSLPSLSSALSLSPSLSSHPLPSPPLLSSLPGTHFPPFSLIFPFILSIDRPLPYNHSNLKLFSDN